MNGCLGGSQRRCQHSRLHHRLEPLDEPRGELPLALYIGQMLFLQALFEQRPGEEVGTGVLATAGGLVFYGQPNGGFAAVDESAGKRFGDPKPTLE